MAQKESHGCLVWLVWASPVLLFLFWGVQYGYNEIKNKDWVGTPNTKRVGAPRTAHELPGAPPGKRIPYPFDPIWQNKIAPVLGALTWPMVFFCLLLLYWLAKAWGNASKREKSADGGRRYKPWERPG